MSLYVGIMASFIGCTIGALLGLTSAFFGGKTDLIVMRFMDVLMAFPHILLALVIMAVLGQGLNNLILALALVMVGRTTRTMRSSALSVRSAVYIDAAVAIGCSSRRILLLHMAPQTMAPFIILVTLEFGYAIIVEAGLSYLGLGVPPPTPSWGSMLTQSQRYLFAAPWLPLLPGLAIVVTVFAINIFGDALRDVLDPRLRAG